MLTYELKQVPKIMKMFRFIFDTCGDAPVVPKSPGFKNEREELEYIDKSNKWMVRSSKEPLGHPDSRRYYWVNEAFLRDVPKTNTRFDVEPVEISLDELKEISTRIF